MPKKIREAPWYSRWKGEIGFTPQSMERGQYMARTVLAPIEAQIAVFFGVKEGNLKALQHGVMKLKNGETITCEVCLQDIYKIGHKRECELVLQRDDVMNAPLPEPPIPRWKQRLNERISAEAEAKKSV